MTGMTAELVYGIHPVRHALEQSSGNALELWLQLGKSPGGDLMQIIALAQQAGISVQHVSRKTLEKHTGEKNHQGVALRLKPVAAANVPDLDRLLARGVTSQLLLLVLDGLQDPHNLGACLRCADGAGVDAVIVPRERAVPVNATVRKVASGAAEHTPIISEANIARALRTLKEAGVWIVGTDSRADKTIYELAFDMPVALVMGAEGQGMRRNTREHCDYLVRLPMHGAVESLNVSVATGICLYEIVRQRNAQRD